MPETEEALEKYLAGGIIKGVGPALAKRIVNAFGEETLSVFKFEPSRLANVKGISESRALEIAQEFNEKWEMWQIVSFLEKFGISSSNCKRVYDALGVNAIREIEANPYILIDITYGVDFKRIDKMAMDLGLPYNSEKRIESGIKYGLILATYNGHTCTGKQNLIQFVINVLDVTTDEIEDCLINLIGKKQVVVEKREDEEWIYLYPFYKAEINITEKIQALMASKNSNHIKNFHNEMLKQERQLDIELSEKQKEAVEAINDNNVCIITGGPGTRQNNNHKRSHSNI